MAYAIILSHCCTVGWNDEAKKYLRVCKLICVKKIFLVPKVHPRYTQGAPKVYPRYTQGAPKVQRGHSAFINPIKAHYPAIVSFTITLTNSAYPAYPA